MSYPKYSLYQIRVFGKESESKISFAVKDIAEFNHLCERFFLQSVSIKVPHGHPRNPLTEEQQKIVDSHIVISDGNEIHDYLVLDTINVNMFDLGVFIIHPDEALHLSPEDTITVDVPKKADFFFTVNYFIAPL